MDLQVPTPLIVLAGLLLIAVGIGNVIAGRSKFDQYAERELPPILVPGPDQREGDEAAEEGDVDRAAVRQEVERAEERERHDQRVAGDAVHAPRPGVARHDRGRTRADEARHQHHEGEPHPDVHRPAEPLPSLDDPEPGSRMLVREEGPHQRHEEGEGDQRVDPAEGVLADAPDDALPYGKARERQVRAGEAEPEERNLRAGGHGPLLARGAVFDKRGPVG